MRQNRRTVAYVLFAILISASGLWGQDVAAQSGSVQIAPKHEQTGRQLGGDPTLAAERAGDVAGLQTNSEAVESAARWERPGPEMVLYDNGPLVNSPETGVGGADESVLQNLSLGMTTLGFGHQLSAGNRVADDFQITGGSWNIEAITFFAYQTGSSAGSTITGVNLQIWNGPPDDPMSSVVWGNTTTNILAASSWTNIYRVTEETTGSASDRPIMANTVTVNTPLPPGTYWLDWQSDGSLSSGPWAPPITIDGQATTGNGKQWTGAWADLLDNGTATVQGLPFIIEGQVQSGLAIDFVVQPSDTTVNQPIQPAIVVSVTDGGSPLPGLTVELTLGNNPGGASPIFLSAITDASGRARFSSVILDAPGQGYTLVASHYIPGFGELSTTSDPFNVYPAGLFIPIPEELQVRDSSLQQILFYCTDPVIPPIPAYETVYPVWAQVFVPQLESEADGYHYRLFGGTSCSGTPLIEDVWDSDPGYDYYGFQFSLPEPGFYCWDVRAWAWYDGIQAFGDFADCCCFEVEDPGCDPLAVPAVTAIADTSCGGQTQNAAPDVSWTDVANEIGYAWEVWSGVSTPWSNPGNLVASGTTGTNVTSANVGVLAPGSYYVRVRALGDGSAYCDSDWSADCQFEVQSACVQLPPPAFLEIGGASCGGTTAEPSPTLVWADIAQELGYEWTVTGLGGIVVDQGTTPPNVTSATVSVSLADGGYSAQVRALGDGEIFCSSEWSPCPFRVDLDSPEVNFTWWPAQPKAGERVRCADQSTGDPIGWLWEFPGGLTSNQQNPVGVFPEPGAYPIILNVEYPQTGWQSIQKVMTVAGIVECGDGSCDSFETAWSCPADCALDPGETGRGGSSDHRPTVPAAVGGIPGVGDTFWMTEGTVFNPGPERTQVVFEYTRRDATGVLEAGPFELEPERGMYWENMVGDLFGVTEAGALWLDSTEPVLFVTRSYNTTGGELKDGGSGTFGQGVSGTTERLTIGQGDGEVYLIGLRDDQAFRSNVFLQEVDGAQVSVRVSIYNDSGQLVRDAILDVQGHSTRTRNLQNLLGQDISSAYATCEVIDGDGRLAAIGSVVDNISTDPTTIDAIHPEQVTTKVLDEKHDLVAVVAHTPGAEGSVWRSGLTIVNPQGAGPQMVRLEYRPANATQPLEETMMIQPGQQLKWEDVLVDVFGYAAGARTKGALHVFSADGVMVDSRTYNQRPDNGTLGQKIPALRAGDMIDVSSRGIIIGLEHNAATRTNIGITEFSGEDTQVRVLFRTTDEDSIPLGGPIVETVPAYEHLQINRVFEERLNLGDDEWQGIKAEVRVLSGGSIYVYASAVDNGSGDATTYTAAIE